MSTHSPEAVIGVRDLHKRFGRQRVHTGIDLEVRRGEFLSVIGGSGSGKSTLLHEVIGLVRPDAGSIRVLGQALHELDIEAARLLRRRWGVLGQTLHELDIEAARLLRRRWGVLFQRGALFSAFNVFDNLAFPMRELRKEGWTVDEAMVHDSVALKLHMVGLGPDDAWKRPAELSGGMLKRAALARALMLEAELLFLDEPTTGLDPASSSEFDALLGSLHKELNLTVMMVTHDLYSMAALSDRIAVLDNGKLIAVGTLDEVAAVNHPFIHEFFRSRRGERQLRRLSRYETR